MSETAGKENTERVGRGKRKVGFLSVALVVVLVPVILLLVFGPSDKKRPTKEEQQTLDAVNAFMEALKNEQPEQARALLAPQFKEQAQEGRDLDAEIEALMTGYSGTVVEYKKLKADDVHLAGSTSKGSNEFLFLEYYVQLEFRTSSDETYYLTCRYTAIDEESSERVGLNDITISSTDPFGDIYKCVGSLHMFWEPTSEEDVV